MKEKETGNSGEEIAPPMILQDSPVSFNKFKHLRPMTEFSNIFNIEPDITLAKTLSAEFYLDNAYLQISKQRIFARTWHLVDSSSIEGNLIPYTLLSGFLDKPLLLSKTKQETYCLSNVCTHRAKVLVEESASGEKIRCGYHGRCFSLGGEFVSMPEFENAKNFPSEQDNLRNFPLEEWNDFRFVALDPVAPLDHFLSEMTRKTEVFNFKDLRFVSKKDYEVNAHWALYCENYLEGLHIPYVHKSLNKVLDYGNYTTETFRYSSLQTGFDDHGNVAAQYFFIFPNLMFNFYPWGISVNVVKPIRKDFTKVTYLTFVCDQSKLGDGAGADLESVELEDQAVVESVQNGIKSGFYQHGRYSPSREVGTHHFHRLICEFMNR